MRAWPLIAALALAATGCVGLDLAELEDRDALSRSLDQPPATTNPARSNTEPRPDFSPLPEPVAAPDPIAPAPPADLQGPSYEPTVGTFAPSPSERLEADPGPPARPLDDVGEVPSIPSGVLLDLERIAAPAIPDTEPEPINAEPINAEPITAEPAAPTTRFASAVDVDAQEPIGPDALDRDSIEELGRFVPPLTDEPPSRERSQPAMAAEPSRASSRMTDTAPDSAPVLVRNPAPEATPPPAREPGTVVATVGNDTITLPEITRAVRARIDRLPGGRRPNRREVIGMVQAEMEARVLESLARQRGRAVLGSSGELDRVLGAIDRHWSDVELPRILQRERVRSAAEFEALLADRGRSLADLRTVYTTRALGKELMRREGRADDDLDAYFEELRDQISVDSALLRTASRQSLR